MSEQITMEPVAHLGYMYSLEAGNISVIPRSHHGSTCYEEET
jgi:hypothetical protein